MTSALEVFAETPPSPPGMVDILSEVLRVVRLTGAIHFNAEFTRPWAFMTSPPGLLAARLMPSAEAITPFHVAISGSSWVSVGNVAPIRIETGDVIIFARGDQHVMCSDVGLPPVPISSVVPKIPAGQTSLVKYGGGGEQARFVCGYLHSDQRFSPLLDALPALICVRVRDGALVLEAFSENGRCFDPVTLEGEASWWQAAVTHLIRESTRPGQGNRAMLARLSELLFMEVVRWQLSYASEGHRGWLSGLNDPQIGRVLALIHAEPSHAWTVDELAQRAAISRSALARRFVELVGEAPMQYLAGWRMHLARRLLRESTLALTEVAARVGYDSEAAFNRAFSRIVGMPPGTWRQAKALSNATESGPPNVQAFAGAASGPSDPDRPQARAANLL